MDKNQDKENVKVKTRIPLPLAPLPPLPKKLLKKLSQRPPLKTLAGPNLHNLNAPSRYESNISCMAGPSKSKHNDTFALLSSPFKMDDTRTFGGDGRRQNCEDAECNFVTYQDDKRRISEASVIIISSDEENDAKEKETNFADKDGPANKKRLSTSNPALNTPARVKNIKRGLKRPHSTELQDLTLLEYLHLCHERAVRRRFLCQTVHERMRSPDPLEKSYTACMERQYTGEILSHLLETEKKPEALPRVDSERRARLINWQMIINGSDGNPATVQTAVWYLDACLATGEVAVENMQLVAAACYWIADKLHGPGTPARVLVKYANHAFTPKMLQEVETMILFKLEFPRHPVVPQDYLCYFAWWCNKERPGEIEVAATFLCLCGLMVNKHLCREYPSVVAAASIINALLLLRRMDLIPRLRECPAFVAAEQKAGNISHRCTILRHAVRVVAAKEYSHKFLYELYGQPPKCIAQTVVSAANEVAAIDDRSSALSKTYSKK